MFPEVPSNPPFPQLEEQVLQFWKDSQIYDKSLQQRSGAENFVFFEGPPTANGMPHPGHCLTRAIKDLFPRYRTMRGFRCQRKAGWDTHGLPVEVEVCKELGIHSKEEIEAFGVEPFIHKCQESVWRYMQEWERLTERLGFWIHLDDAYVTYEQSYVESVWWSLQNLFDRGLLYQGYKIVWWWAQGGTALSAGEVGQGYREVADPSVYVRFPLCEKPDTSLLVWTTTPWTLPSNQFVAVNPELEYATVEEEETGLRLILAASLVETVAEKKKQTLQVVETCLGSELLGQRYRPPFDYYYQQDGETTGTLQDGQTQHVAWRVVAGDFVTTESGTGVVHQAPAFGEVDFDVLLEQQQRFVDDSGPRLICSVGPDGKFTEETPGYQGRWVKEADKDISRQLREEGKLYHLEQYLHDYPFCWRAEQDPLIQYPRHSWFIRTTEFKDQMLRNNQQIQWQPEHIRDGRFGKFLESNVDWALSRERYWGTPLPIWVCEETGKQEAVGCYQQLLDKPGVDGTQVWEQAKQENPELVEDLKVHKPYIDAITYDSPFAEGARMQRVTEVIDCWYDSGAMPFAQWGYPHQGQEAFADQFPADFISEALDQTRGWFYSQLAISTMLFGPGSDDQGGDEATPVHEFPHPFRNCIVLGLMLGEDGRKMSKSLRNYREPQEIFDRYGADALRWYFFANQAPWTPIRYKEQAIKASIPEFLLRLWNVFSFFNIYANIDGFNPAEEIAGEAGQLTADVLAQAASYRVVGERGELDRWLLGELNETNRIVIERMDAYDNYAAANCLNDFVDALSNWYVRRSRDRFWSAERADPQKMDAYWTLYEALLTLSKLIAPLTPFLAETLWQNLTAVFDGRTAESVHLCDYPEPNETRSDRTLSEQMTVLREIASLGRSARMEAALKVRQPLAKVEVILGQTEHQGWLQEHDQLLSEELNVKEVAYTQEAEEYITYQVVPNFKRLGPRVGKLMPKVKQALQGIDGGAMLAELNQNGQVDLDLGEETIQLDQEDIEVRLQAREGWAAAQGQNCVVVLATELTDDLLKEGYARDLVRLIQERRKELDCQFTDRIEVAIVGAEGQLAAAVDEFSDYIQRETLANSISSEATGGEAVAHEVAEMSITMSVQVAGQDASDDAPTEK
jgi:isoleucyl-tRNA synthetase